MHNVIFKDLKRVIDEKNKPLKEIKIAKMVKVDGENVSIRYSKSLNSWLIGSENVCIMA